MIVDLEVRLLRDFDETRFREICQTALEGLATPHLNLEMLVERRARAQEHRVVPETIARFISESGKRADLALRPVRNLPHTFRRGTHAAGAAQLQPANPRTGRQLRPALH